MYRQGMGALSSYACTNCGGKKGLCWLAFWHEVFYSISIGLNNGMLIAGDAVICFLLTAIFFNPDGCAAKSIYKNIDALLYLCKYGAGL